MAITGTGLFQNPQQILAAEQAARAGQDPNAALRAALVGAGRAGAGAFSRGIGGAGLPESPEIQLARTRQDIMKGIDLTDRNSLIQGSQNLVKAGDIAGAQQLAQQALAIEVPEPAKPFTLGPGQQRFDAEGNLIVGVDPKATPDKVPTTRNIRKGKDVVNQEWNPETRQWAEVGRGPLGAGVSVRLDSGNKLWDTVYDNYQKELKPVTEKRAIADEIKVSASIEGGVAPQALQSGLVNMFGTSARAITELERWGNFGDLPERVVNAASKFFTGDFSDVAKGDVLRLLRNYESKVLNKKQEEINKRFKKTATAAKVPHDFFIQETPSIRNINYTTLSLEDIAAMTPDFISQLDLDERQALEERLTDLGL